jgi:SEC-C motif-containing protein
LHNRQTIASSAEQLMRSRYSAFVRDEWDYVFATWHPSTRPERNSLSHDPKIKWLSLNIIQSQSIGHDANVEFVTRFKYSGRAGQLHERSRFVFEHNRWFYLDGVIFE